MLCRNGYINVNDTDLVLICLQIYLSRMFGVCPEEINGNTVFSTKVLAEPGGYPFNASTLEGGRGKQSSVNLRSVCEF